MVMLGFILRYSPLPRELLGVIYLAIGVGLLYASGEYWRGQENVRTEIAPSNSDQNHNWGGGSRVKFEVLPPRKDNHLFEVVYIEKYGYLESVLIPEAPLFGFTSLYFEGIELEVSWTGIVDHIGGRTGHGYWITSELHPPESVPGGIRAITDSPLQKGVVEPCSLTVRKVYHDPSSDWLCIGDKDAKGEFCIAIVPSLIIVGKSQQIEAIWVHIARCQSEE
jgi:hypothetical protein